MRSDLSPGQQLAQAVHAAFRFAHDWPETVHEWVEESNFLVIVAAPEIAPIVGRCNEEGLRYSIAVEPDLDNQWTAVALQPGVDARRLCANFPLALKEHVMT